MIPDPILAAGPTALPLLIELGAGAVLALAFALRGPVRRLLRRAPGATRRRAAARARAV